MTASARKIVVVSEGAMMESAAYRAMKNAGSAKVETMRSQIQHWIAERTAYEAQRERVIDGETKVGQSPDIKHVQALDTEAVARLFIAQKVDPQSYIHPMSRGSKSSNETSNLKAYAKTRQIADLIWSGASSLENVVKVFTVCAFRAASQRSALIERDFAECFLSSIEFRTIAQGSEDLWSAIDDVRAKHMTTGAQTQTSQMIRTLVALGSAEDVRDGRRKNVRIDPEGRVLQAIMRRFGQVTSDNAPTEADA